MIISDSMASDCCGWGGGIYRYFKPDATVINKAQPWMGTKTFLQSEELQHMLLIKPDYVLMQYGFIDSGSDPDRSTTIEEFEANLRTIISMIRDFDGVPVLVTLHAPRRWDAEGKLLAAWGPQNAVTKKLAAEFDLPLVDFYEITKKLFTELGPSGTEFMHWYGGDDPQDSMHFSHLGAEYVSRHLVNALPEALRPYLTGVLDPPPVPAP